MIIAGYGWARMAWKLAQDRTSPMEWVGGPRERHPDDSEPLKSGAYDGPSRQYYRILDQTEHWWSLRSIYPTVYFP